MDIKLESFSGFITGVAPIVASVMAIVYGMFSCFLFGYSLHLPVTGSAITLRVSRLQSSFRAYFALVLRPASWLALLSRTFTFELAPTRSP